MARIIVCETDDIEKDIAGFLIKYVDIMFSDEYVSEDQAKQVFEVYKETYESIKGLQDLTELKNKLEINSAWLYFFLDKMSKFEQEMETHNRWYINRELSISQLYLDSILENVDPKIRLDEEQRKVVLNDSDASLVVAGAGAGKTTTVAAKVKYLVEKRRIKPEEIIVISFTRKAVKELSDKINKQLEINAKVTTFHAFGNEIIRNTTEDYPEVETYKRKYFLDILKNRIYDNRMLLKNLVLFLGYYMDIPEEALKFQTLSQYHTYKVSVELESLRSTLNQYTKQVTDSLTKQVRTIKGEFLRSVQEVQIANFLYLHGLEYEYEKVYEFDIVHAKKKYTPDFFIKQGTHEVYLEHFGINEDGTSNRFSKKELEKYKKSITDKIQLHKKYKTEIIWTFSAYNDGRSLLEHLEALLLKQGFQLYRKDDEEVYRQLMRIESDKYIYRFAIFMETFISRFKTNGYDESDFQRLRNKTDNVRNTLFLDIAEEVYKQYQAMLIQKRKIDFEDMINRAEKTLAQYNQEKVPLNYKYVIIDEYQDIARQRFQLTKRLADICRAKIIAVGDDWQSIYAFSGSDISLFTQFIDLMGHGEMLKITKTYRNSQELIDIAGNFIQENESQIKKRLKSPKHIDNPIIVKVYDDSYDIMKHKVAALLEALGHIHSEFGDTAEVLLIGRYGFDVNQICKTGEFSQNAQRNKSKVTCKRYPKMRLTYLTAHSSKGLGYENVIILNGMEGKFGFPSQIEDDPILKLVTVEDHTLLFAEERRLFYVALTRTKNRTYILTPENRPSRFVMELVDKYHIQVDRKLNYHAMSNSGIVANCPVCGYPLKKEYNQNYGLTLYMCTNEPEVCDFMSNKLDCLKDIHKCERCKNGYMIVKPNSKTGQFFFGCTNYNTVGIRCKNNETIYGSVKNSQSYF